MSTDDDGKIEIIKGDDQDNEIENDVEQSKSEFEKFSESDESAVTGDYKDKYNELYNRFIRLAADFENYKKRSAKEKSDISNYGNEELIKALLNVIDNLERAIDHGDDGNQKALIEGIKIVYNQFISCLEKFGLEKISSEKGTEFNPNIHQALERVESEELTQGLILSDLVKGYKLKDRLLRPAVVIVSTGIIERDEDDTDNTENVEDYELSNENGSTENMDDKANGSSDSEIKNIIDIKEEG